MNIIKYRGEPRFERGMVRVLILRSIALHFPCFSVFQFRHSPCIILSHCHSISFIYFTRFRSGYSQPLLYASNVYRSITLNNKLSIYISYYIELYQLLPTSSDVLYSVILLKEDGGSYLTFRSRIRPCCRWRDIAWISP